MSSLSYLSPRVWTPRRVPHGIEVVMSHPVEGGKPIVVGRSTRTRARVEEARAMESARFEARELWGIHARRAVVEYGLECAPSPAGRPNPSPILPQAPPSKLPMIAVAAGLAVLVVAAVAVSR